MTIEEIYNSENISIRSFNVCYYNGLKDLNAILKYYRENKTFDNLRNCGTKSNEELILLCLKYVHIENTDTFIGSKIENPLILKISNLNRTQRELINSFIDIITNNLSNRSRNAITTFLNGNIKLKNISERILINDRFNIYHLKNIGAKSVVELDSFINSIKDFIEKVSHVVNENDLIALRNRFFIEKTFSISEIPNEVLISQSIFKLTDFLINQNAIFEKHQNNIFQKAFRIYRNQPELTLDEIAENLCLSRERVRQLRKKCLENIFNKFQFIKSIDDDLFQKYSIDSSQDFISIGEDLNYLINEINNTNFSNEFITLLIYIYSADKFEIVGNIEDVLQPKYFNSSNRHNWNNFYLVNKTIINEVDFIAFADDIDYRLSGRIEETYSFNFKSYLNSFLKKHDTAMLSLIFPIAEIILNNEFGLSIDLDDNLVFKRNTIKTVPEYAIEALEKLGTQSKIEDIYKLVEQDFPGITKSQEALRGSLQRTPEIIYFGRSSTYGLKKWEKENANIKGGTIRQIVIEYLDHNSSPKHITEITSHVLKFRPMSNEHSILQNLKLDESGTFIFFKNSFIGVSYKKYDETYILLDDSNITDKKTWEERYINLKEFLNTNNRLPFSSGCAEEEISLYRWYNIQLRKAKNRDLEEEKCILIEDISAIYDNKRRTRQRRSNYTEKSNELKQFIIDKKRLPSANKTGEENLYQFFYKQRKLFEHGHLNQLEKNNFIEIAKIIQNNTHEN